MPAQLPLPHFPPPALSPARSRCRLSHIPAMQHVAFWDRNADGLITPADVYVGFRQAGLRSGHRVHSPLPSSCMQLSCSPVHVPALQLSHLSRIAPSGQPGESITVHRRNLPDVGADRCAGA